jgi:aconitate hydratase
VPVALEDGTGFDLDHGHVVIAAITSCTNTSNPSVMLAAGLLARNAVDRGLASKPWVKTSLAPGSKVVMDYYERAGLLPYLEKLGFHLVGFGCTTCIGNSGPLAPEISRAVDEHDLVVASVLSGNRNFEGRINPDCRMNYLASPPLVVAYALAGTMDIDLLDDPLGHDPDGNPGLPARPVAVQRRGGRADRPGRPVGHVPQELRRGVRRRRALELPGRADGESFAWDDASTYVRRPPYFDGMPATPEPVTDIHGARVLAVLGDSVTTDHISPAGVIKRDSPAGRYLTGAGRPAEGLQLLRVPAGQPRGDDPRHLRQHPPAQPARPRHRGRGHPAPARRRADEHLRRRHALPGRRRPLVVLAGKEYGSGSSRDWAAKGRCCSGSGPCWPRATSASTGPTWSAWASCP